ncbi:MAG: hypothetical protein P8L30_14150 [Longimicrobiales bacterium]|nr:hypothetical protein [Longimicrobiales bacterium]
MPAHTGSHGLQDRALEMAFRPARDINFGADSHSFSAEEQGALAEIHSANELDLTRTPRYTSKLSATMGFAYVIQHDAMATIGRLDEDMTWFYLMLNSIVYLTEQPLRQPAWGSRLAAARPLRRAVNAGRLLLCTSNGEEFPCSAVLWFSRSRSRR